MSILWNILLLGVAVFAVSRILPGIHVKHFGTAIVVAVVYSLINFLIGWLLVAISIPFIFITFGLFKLVINAFLLFLTDQLMDDFKIEGLSTTLLAAVLITIIDSVLRWVFLSG
ncbi:phage holin family protein [Thermodesulfobacteriota bacterium]